jgi:lysozyme
MRFPQSLSARALLVLVALEGGIVLMPYLDVGGVWTDGAGNTRNVVPGKPITVQKGLEDLGFNVAEIERGINRCIKVPLPQKTFDSFVLLGYNIGASKFCQSGLSPDFSYGELSETPQKERLIDLINKGDIRAACDRILQFNKVRINGKLVPVKGLTNRREKERKMCLEGLQ